VSSHARVIQNNSGITLSLENKKITQASALTPRQCNNKSS